MRTHKKSKITTFKLGLFHHERVFIFTKSTSAGRMEGQPANFLSYCADRGPGGGKTPTLQSLPGCLETLIWSWQCAAGSRAPSLRDGSLTISHFLSFPWTHTYTHIHRDLLTKPQLPAPCSQHSVLAGSQQRGTTGIVLLSDVEPPRWP